MILAFVSAVKTQAAAVNSISPWCYDNAWYVTGSIEVFSPAPGIAKFLHTPPDEFAAALARASSMVVWIRH